MSSPVFLHLREIECWKCGSARLADGTRCQCGAYQNKNIQLCDGQWRDVRYAPRPVTIESESPTHRVQ